MSQKTNISLREIANIIYFYMKKTVSLIFVIVGTIIGAGFATGKEVAVYFTRFGYMTIPCAIMCGVFFYYINYLFLRLHRVEKFDNYLDFSRKVFGKFSSVVNLFLCTCFIILSGSMYAGINAMQFMLTGLSFPFFSLISALLCVRICVKGASALSNANLIVIPLVIVLTVIVCVKGVAQPSGYGFSVGMSSIPLSIIFCIVYIGMNMVLSGIFLSIIGKEYSAKQSKTASFVSSVMITLLIILISVCLFFNPILLDVDLPLLELSYSMSHVWGIIFCVMTWLAIFTTLISSTFTTINMITMKKNKLYIILIVVLLGYILSLFTFSKIVSILYPIIGVAGILFISTVAIFCIKKRIVIQKSGVLEDKNKKIVKG